MKLLLLVLGLIVIVGGGGGWYLLEHSKPHIEFKTAEVKRGDLLATISATGTLEPEEVVDVGAQVTGPIVTFGKDAQGNRVDNRSPVEPGMLLAKIDETTYRADRDTATAQLQQAKANLEKAQADLEQTQALYEQAAGNWERAQKIGIGDALSQNDYYQYKATYASTKANVAVAKAEIVQAQTGIPQAQATLDKAQRNLDFCTINSPIKGVIIDRRVNIGQTVVGSLTPASMFLIAKDLTHMQIWVAVNEADIGRIYPGQNVTFTVDAFPNKTFTGKVNKVRLFATMTQNVVTYTVEVSCENPNGVLYPHMTANTQFEVQKDPDVLLVPNAALRWYPSDADEVAEDVRSTWKPIDSDEPEQPQGTPPPNNAAKKNKAPHERHGTIWTTDGKFVRPINVTIHATDGVNTEISGADVKQGEQIVVGEIVPTAQEGQERNPFLPQLHRHK